MRSYVQPKIFHQFKELIAVQSTRHGGKSSSPYHSLNLGLHTNDLHERVTSNRVSFFQSLGIKRENIAQSYQVHGNQILNVDHPISTTGFDALITNHPNIFLAITIADCVPILIYDPKTRSLAAIHAGWKGTKLSIVSRTVEQLQQTYKVNPKHCYAYIGTCISQKAFEVGIEVADQFEGQFKKWNTLTNKYHIDLKGANLFQLSSMGIPTNQIETSDQCTFLNNEDFFSHRKEKGTTGRMLAVIGRIDTPSKI